MPPYRRFAATDQPLLPAIFPFLQHWEDAPTCPRLQRCQMTKAAPSIDTEDRRPAMKYVPLVARVLLTIAFVMSGGAKLAGVAAMVEMFDAIGVGQWFRYVTGIVEVGGAAMLWYKPTRILGALLLGATMLGAVVAHMLFLGPSTLPAIMLGILAVIVIRFERKPAA
jgi:uncharacterized membrane protein YphA (DoxX/SURF4 family)